MFKLWSLGSLEPCIYESTIIFQTSLDAIVFSLKLKIFFLRFFLRFFWDFFKDFFERFFFLNLNSVWFDLVVYQVSTFYYVWNWSKSLWWWVGGWWVCKPNLIKRFCPRLFWTCVLCLCLGKPQSFIFNWAPPL